LRERAPWVGKVTLLAPGGATAPSLPRGPPLPPLRARRLPFAGLGPVERKGSRGPRVAAAVGSQATTGWGRAAVRSSGRPVASSPPRALGSSPRRAPGRLCGGGGRSRDLGGGALGGRAVRGGRRGEGSVGGLSLTTVVARARRRTSRRAKGRLRRSFPVVLGPYRALAGAGLASEGGSCAPLATAVATGRLRTTRRAKGRLRRSFPVDLGPYRALAGVGRAREGGSCPPRALSQVEHPRRQTAIETLPQVL
jgi:hypothetical protein